MIGWLQAQLPKCYIAIRGRNTAQPEPYTTSLHHIRCKVRTFLASGVVQAGGQGCLLPGCRHGWETGIFCLHVLTCLCLFLQQACTRMSV